MVRKQYVAPEDQSGDRTVGDGRMLVTRTLSQRDYDRIRLAAALEKVSVSSVVKTLMRRWADVVLANHPDTGTDR
jgi:hypothetical protein